ncbi:MAG: hypothetical protein M3Y67_01250 [Pseudomonadota bacterium]|nr:hypothetical protein [Pseudomonadota bacterium]
MVNLKTVAVALSALALSACVVAPYPRQSAYYPEAGGVYAEAPPPAPYVEVVPAIPYPGAVWIGGYWGWSGGRHNWVGGRWERPRPGYAWAPHRWEQRGSRWHLRDGGWVRR